MASDDTIVSPYLLRPLRTLEQVLGGRSRAVESGSERAEGLQARDRAGCAAGQRMASIGLSHARQD
jgi:hypothetical protein